MAVIDESEKYFVCDFIQIFSVPIFETVDVPFSVVV